MRIVVCIKQVGVLGDEVAFDADGTGVDPDYLDPALNEWDAYAIEAALNLREEAGGEVIAITCGGKDSETVLRRALAMGADRAIRVDAAPGPDALAPARTLAEAIRAHAPDVVLCGAQTSDASFGATPSGLAGLLDLSIATVVRRIELEPDGKSAVVHRELEAGLIDVIELRLPAVIGVQTGINEPRYAGIRAIRQAEASAIEVVGSSVESVTTVHRMQQTPRSSSVVMIEGGAGEIARRISDLVRERVT
jgi:electron transfer flavoprotein beta subunit